MRVKCGILLILGMVVASLACAKGDAELTLEVDRKLKADGVKTLSAAVKDGVAVLSGEVENDSVITKAEASARAVEGIRSVDSSNVVVTSKTDARAGNGTGSTSQLNADLINSGCKGASAVSLNGVVMVVGEVPAAKFDECSEIVARSGISGIRNEMKKGR